ncbi:hypothetical protein [Achromobacter sp. ACM05]|uniref:hypothetical protein n=1 Tax=Achromobacter sp. ACM05 TaxID=2854776 RepID=UPI001C4944AD|nr:hypothetical protein [Achromobacter sp. ACM05]MBV7502068.1 hypothetical protein [Achromobacter sp. ACM05]
MTTHTPGPWHLSAAKDCIWHQDHGRVCTWPNHAQVWNWEANARLIAAAPDLLDALAALIGCIDHGSDDPASKLDAARAAIAKATGA